MTDKRPIVLLLPLALLAGCGEESTDDSRAASGEVLEGTISDAMLPLDRVQSEPPLEDPKAFAEAQEKTDAEASSGQGEGDAQAETNDGEASEPEQPAVEVPNLEAE
jgi:hypothetical protein